MHSKWVIKIQLICIENYNLSSSNFNYHQPAYLRRLKQTAVSDTRQVLVGRCEVSRQKRNYVVSRSEYVYIYASACKVLLFSRNLLFHICTHVYMYIIYISTKLITTHLLCGNFYCRSFVS